MKVKLFAVGALILLSSITSIYDNLGVVDTSAQLYEDKDAFDAVFEYLADDHDNKYNGYDNTDRSSSYEQSSSEYSSYNNYEPSDYGNSYDSSYNNDGYGASDGISYDSSYSNDGYGAKNSYNYDDKYSKYPPKENKKFTCPNSGLVVDKKENCPVICPPGSTLEGHFVKAGSNLQKVCNVGTDTLETCDAGTDLEGVFVSNPATDCDLPVDNEELETCPAGTALAGVAVPDNGDPNTAPAACNARGLEICPAGTEQFGHFVMGDGILATTAELLPLCDLPDAVVEVCAESTDLAGMVVSNTDDANDGMEDACEISLDDVELEICPDGTALAGVAVPDNGDPTTAPAACSASGLEVCPVGTEQEGHFVQGDGNLATNQVTDPTDTTTYDLELAAICNANDDQSEVCPDNTQLVGILVEDTVMDPDIEPACNPFEICPDDTILADVAVLDDGDPITIPEVCQLDTLAGSIQNCIAYWLSLADGSARVGTITAIVVGLAELVQYNLGVTVPEDTIDDYPFLDAYDNNNDGDITDNGEFVCTTSSTTTCPHDFELVDLFVDLINAGYDLTNAVNLPNNGPPTPDADDLEEAILDEGGNQEDQITRGIFDCIEEKNPELSLQAISSSDFAEQGIATTSSKSAVNIENVEQAQAKSLQDTSITTSVKAEPEIPTTTTDLNNPTTTTDLNNPTTTTDLNNPTTTTDLNNPTTNTDLNNPTTNTDLNNSTTNTDLNNSTLNTDSVSPTLNVESQIPSLSALTGLFP